MARPIPDLDPMEANEVATDDDLLIDDISAGETKRIQVGKLLGLPKVGWTAAGESWSYNTFSSSTRVGVITVPSDATTKYSAGMKIRITQATGGTKYGFIVDVTSTTLKVFFGPGVTFNNEAITDPYYSVQDMPFGYTGPILTRETKDKNGTLTTVWVYTVAGFDSMLGNGASIMTGTIAFPITFHELHSVMVTPMGVSATGGTNITDTTDAYTTTAVQPTVSSWAVTTSNFKYNLSRTQGTFGGTTQYFVSYMAKGVVA